MLHSACGIFTLRNLRVDVFAVRPGTLPSQLSDWWVVRHAVSDLPTKIARAIGASARIGVRLPGWPFSEAFESDVRTCRVPIGDSEGDEVLSRAERGASWQAQID